MHKKEKYIISQYQSIETNKMSSPSALITTSYSIVALVGERILAAEEEEQQNNSNSNSNSTTSSNSTITDDEIGENEDHLYILDKQQLLIGVIAPRIAGFVILISSIFMVYMSWKRRYKLFHRLVLGTYYCMERKGKEKEKKKQKRNN
jgi:hypothetical protein